MANETTLDKHLLELRTATGCAKWTLLYCPSCAPRKLASSYHSHDSYRWAVTLSCNSCMTSWAVCTECSSARQHYVEWAQLRRHASRKKHEASFGLHQIKRNQNFTHRVLTGTKEKHASPTAIDTFDEIPNAMIDDINDSDILTVSERPTFAFSTQNSTRYFERDHDGGLGNASLVAFSQFRLARQANHLDKAEVSVHVKIASLVSTLTVGQQKKFSQILADIDEVKNSAGDHCVSDVHAESVWKTKFPTSVNDIRSFYLKGKYAMLPNLPRPSVHEVSNHAYVSLKDCVADILAHGLKLDNIDFDRRDVPAGESTITRIRETIRGKQIWENGKALHFGKPVFCLYINEWSDDFEPSYSIKGNRGSAWIKTVTISPPPGKIHALTHTYPIAIGLKGDSHEEVERKFATELSTLSTGSNNVFYQGSSKQNVNVHLELFVSLQDQPERRSANYVMLGTSTYTARWGHAMDFAAVASGIPSCSHCLMQLLRVPVTQGTPPIRCDSCVNWETTRISGLLDFPPPPGYPQDMVPVSGKLSPLKLEYSLMQQAVSLAHEKIVENSWTTDNARTYLRVHGLNSEAIDDIIECAQNCNTYARMKRDQVHSPHAFAEIEQERLHHPELFRQWRFPALWDRGVDLRQHIDVAMHLLFLGVVKTTIQLVKEWAKMRCKYQSFLTYCNGTFETVQSLGLSWCRVLPYSSGKLGGWVSENYLAACRLLPWFYCAIDDIAPDPVFVPPDRPQNNWTSVQNKGWLAARGLDTKGKALEVRTRVNAYMEQPGGAPPVLSPQGGPVANVHAVISALNAMVSRLMSPTVTPEHIVDVERHIKIFLSSFETFDEGMRTEKDKPRWISSYNFVCLLNLPDVIREFGPLRNLWEGGGQGEKFLRLVKPKWHGYRKNWQVNMMDGLLQQIAMRRVEDKENESSSPWLAQDDEDDDDGTDEELCADRQFVLYSNADYIRRIHRLRHPLSVVTFKNNDKFLCMMRDKTCVEINCCAWSETTGGAVYHHWEVGETSTLSNDEMQSHLCRSCLLLPRLRQKGMPGEEDEPIYTLVESQWGVISVDKLIRLPEFLHAEY
jgi:hypothetical protein